MLEKITSPLPTYVISQEVQKALEHLKAYDSFN